MGVVARDVSRLARRCVPRRHLAAMSSLCAFAVAGGAWTLLGSDAFAVREVSVEGTSRLSPATVLDAAAVTPGTPLATLDTDAVERRIRTLPAVRQVHVLRRWPATVEIAVGERKPVAVRRVGGAYLLVDPSGVVLERVRRKPKGFALVSAPVRVDSAGRTGAPDPRALRAALSVLGSLPQPVRSKVVEVRAAGPETVTLRLTRGRIVIWGGPERAARKGQVLSALMTRKAKVYDVSAPDTPTTRA